MVETAEMERMGKMEQTGPSDHSALLVFLEKTEGTACQGLWEGMEGMGLWDLKGKMAGMVFQVPRVFLGLRDVMEEMA